MGAGSEYYYFISYKRDDEKWAKCLQIKLENYWLPMIIGRVKLRLPKRIRYVFKDKTDLGTGVFTNSLQKKLDKSQYLIVICSPQSSQSEWARKEILAFTDIGRANRIIPFFVGGEPNNKDLSKECFMLYNSKKRL